MGTKTKTWKKSSSNLSSAISNFIEKSHDMQKDFKNVIKVIEETLPLNDII